MTSIAAYIAASGRALLWATMDYIKACGGVVYMCDTDSIITDYELPEELVGNDIGQWKVEEISEPEECYFYCPKHYEFNDKATIKGAKEPEAGKLEYDQHQFTNIMSRFKQIRIEKDQGPKIKKVKKVFAGINNKRKEPRRKNGATLPLNAAQLNII